MYMLTKILTHTHSHTCSRTDVVQMLPFTSVSVDMKPDMAGIWLLHCHVSHHMHTGMVATYTVARSASQFANGAHPTASQLADASASSVSTVSADGTIRKYYVACEEQVWNYAPTGMNGLLGQPLKDTRAATYLVRPFGHTYMFVRPPTQVRTKSNRKWTCLPGADEENHVLTLFARFTGAKRDAHRADVAQGAVHRVHGRDVQQGQGGA